MTEATELATASYFLGRWQMVRLIDDHIAGAFGEFWGEAEFAAAREEQDTGGSAGEAARAHDATGPLDWPPAGIAGDAEAGPAADPRDGLPGEALICRENGVLRFSGRDFAAGRVTFWRFAADGAIHVAYDDGRPFHSFRLAAPQGLHLCGADRYEVSYTFSADSWISHWTVVGPRKDYSMVTRYCRIATPAG